MLCISPSYREDDDDADVFGIFPELVPRDHAGVVNESKSEDEQTKQLHQHRGLKTQEDTVRLLPATGVAGSDRTSICPSEQFTAPFGSHIYGTSEQILSFHQKSSIFTQHLASSDVSTEAKTTLHNLPMSRNEGRTACDTRRPSHPGGQRDDGGILEERQTQVHQDEEVEEHLREPVVVAQIQSGDTNTAALTFEDRYEPTSGA